MLAPGLRRAGFVLVFAAAGASGPVAMGQAPEGGRRQITVTMRDSGYDPARLEVRQNELVQITFVSSDEPHAFTLDALQLGAGAVADEVVEGRQERRARLPVAGLEPVQERQIRGVDVPGAGQRLAALPLHGEAL